MVTKFFKSILFISSFLPLYVILIIKFYEFDKPILCNLRDHWGIFLFCGILIMASVVTFLYFLYCELNKEVRVGSLENVNTEILTYFITYVIPLTTLEEGDINSIIINLILFIVIGIFHVNSNQFYLNILFTLFGFNVYKDENKNIFITKQSANKISNRDTVLSKQAGVNIYIINKSKRNKKNSD